MKKFSFVKNQKIFFGIVLLMVVIGLVSFFTKGFNLDIDFVGGTEISYNMGTSVTPEQEKEIANDVKAIIGEENFSSIRLSGNKDIVTIRTLVIDNEDKTSEVSASIEAKMLELFPNAILDPQSSDVDKIYVLPDDNAEDDVTPEWTQDQVTLVQETFGDVNELSVSSSTNTLYVSFVSSSLVAQYRSEITDAITAKFENATWQSIDTVSAEVSDGLKNTAVVATSLAVILMLVYIAFRFQISSAFAAIVCLIHDLFIVIVAYSLFSIPVNVNIIAALLTILGYSINATIIIFDRIREDNKKFNGANFAEKVDNGIRNTLRRSINTTLTTLFTIGMVYILGVDSIKDFTLPIIVGLIAGLFSSVCLAGPLWNAFKNIGANMKKSKKR